MGGGGEGSLLSRVYLAGYNAAQLCGWTLLLIRLLGQVQQKSGIDNEAQVHLASFLQLAAFLEVLHAAIGLVRSGTLTAFMQWAGRTHVIVAVVSPIREVHQSPWLIQMLAAWSLSEVIRYPHYIFNILGVSPQWLTWLRYTQFVVLFPVGVLSEMIIMYSALPFINKRDLYGYLFKWTPFSYHEFVEALLVVWPLLAFVLYRHMLLQRRAKLQQKPAARKKNM